MSGMKKQVSWKNQETFTNLRRSKINVEIENIQSSERKKCRNRKTCDAQKEQDHRRKRKTHKVQNEQDHRRNRKIYKAQKE